MRSLIALLVLLIAIPAAASAQDITLDGQDTELVLRDSENAHTAAKAAFDTISCIMVAIQEEVEWTPRDCVDRLKEAMDPLSREHRLLHPALEALLLKKRGTKS